MDYFTNNSLNSLVRYEGHCVSFYLPTHRTSPESQQNPIRFRNMLDEAARSLEGSGMGHREAKQFLRPGSELLDDADFWMHQSDGLAVFVGTKRFQRFRLPEEFDQEVVTGSTFHLTPLIQHAQSNGVFHVLAISPNSCRLLKGDRGRLVECNVEDLPNDLQSALGWWRERELNFRSHFSGANSAAGDDTAMFHGHEEDDRRIDLTAYFRRVAKALVPVVNEVPLVLAAVKESFPIFKEVAEDLPLVSEPIAGNPDEKAPHELHAAAWPLIEPVVREPTRQAVERYRNAQSADHTTDSLSVILPAARDGLIDTLLLPHGSRASGEFNFRTGKVRRTVVGEVEDLLNLAAVLTLRTRGEVYVVDIDQIPESAALLRAPAESIATADRTPNQDAADISVQSREAAHELS